MRSGWIGEPGADEECFNEGQALEQTGRTSRKSLAYSNLLLDFFG